MCLLFTVSLCIWYPYGNRLYVQVVHIRTYHACIPPACTCPRKNFGEKPLVKNTVWVSYHLHLPLDDKSHRLHNVWSHPKTYVAVQIYYPALCPTIFLPLGSLGGKKWKGGAPGESMPISNLSCWNTLFDLRSKCDMACCHWDAGLTPLCVFSFRGSCSAHTCQERLVRRGSGRLSAQTSSFRCLLLRPVLGAATARYPTLLSPLLVTLLPPERYFIRARVVDRVYALLRYWMTSLSCAVKVRAQNGNWTPLWSFKEDVWYVLYVMFL